LEIHKSPGILRTAWNLHYPVRKCWGKLPRDQIFRSRIYELLSLRINFKNSVKTEVQIYWQVYTLSIWHTYTSNILAWCRTCINFYMKMYVFYWKDKIIWSPWPKNRTLSNLKYCSVNFLVFISFFSLFLCINSHPDFCVNYFLLAFISHFYVMCASLKIILLTFLWFKEIYEITQWISFGVS
jgi:hypothetical protein